jgi:very-short-patch-repair endonuclease
MAGDIDRVQLRNLVGLVIGDPARYTHRSLPEELTRVGLPEPPGEGSKRERIEGSLAALPDVDLPMVAAQILVSGFSMHAATRNAIQDILWAGKGGHEIPKKTRRELSRTLDLGELVQNVDRFRDLLDRLWVLDDDPFSWPGAHDHSLRAHVEGHVFRNPGDWDAEALFEGLGAFDASDARFARFLEELTSGDILLDEPLQRRVVETMNPHLRTIGAELRETGEDGGYPVFTLVSQSARTRQPKNLIFASLAGKPDIRFLDAIDNDIEIVGNEDDVLIYDRPFGPDGVRWKDLQAWWREKRQIDDEDEAKRSLYQRLLKSLPDSSPPQRNLFELYYAIHGSAVQNLPALLPEVWLLWDPKTVRQRGPQALLQFRMDLVLILPRGRRVVLEVDGSHHYSSGGRADTAKYASNMRGDRDLKLNGYDVFRFGAVELQDRESARALLSHFFADLFRHFHVSPSPR